MGGGKKITDRQTDIHTENMKTEDPLIAGTTGSPSGRGPIFPRVYLL